jgi:RimJ/RimL family protein N-acetyltransferase
MPGAPRRHAASSGRSTPLKVADERAVGDLTFPLSTSRLLLRPFVEDDLDALHDMQSREEVTRFLNWGPMSRDEARVMLERISKLTGFEGEGEGLRLAGITADDGTPIGDFSLWRVSREHNTAEIGFVLHPDHQGKGYASEAMTALLRIGFEELGFHRIVGRCDARNTRSAALMERLGMRKEAHLRQNELVKGEWTDELIYAILDSGWASRR